MPQENNLLTELTLVLKSIGQDIYNIANNLSNAKQLSNDLLSYTRSEKDANNIFRVTQYYRDDGTLFRKAELSGGTSPQYAVLTIEDYDITGQNVELTRMYALGYDGADIVSRVLITPPND